MKRILLFVTVMLVGSVILTGCKKDSDSTGNDNKKIIVFSSLEDFRNEELRKQFKVKFPDLELVIQYLPTGNNAAKLKAEGTATQADIVLGLDTAYMEDNIDLYVNVSEYARKDYLPGLNPDKGQYLIWEKYSGAIIINTDVLSKKGLPEPKTYQDLKDPKYKGLIVMPNPKTSGTGYFFLKNLVNELGEKDALAYFDELQKNVKQFTESGSAPVTLLSQGEAAIGLSTTFKAAKEIEKNVPLKIIEPEYGSPFSLSGFGIISGKEKNKNVIEVYKWLASDFVVYDKENFSPDKIFENQKTVVKNYPDFESADMKGINDSKEKEMLLKEWKY